MAHSLAGGRPLLPRPCKLLPDAAFTTMTESLPSGAFGNPVMPPPRRPKTRTKTTEEWDEQADSIRELYHIMSLDAMISTLDEQAGSQAS